MPYLGVEPVSAEALFLGDGVAVAPFDTISPDS